VGQKRISTRIAESLTFALVIEPALSPEDVASVRGLFVEYRESLGVDLCFQGFDQELAELPGDYVSPGGCLLAAKDAGEVVACVALRRLDAQTCEMKRLYVLPSHRGLGLGRALAEAVIAEARRMGYQRMRLDTLPSMAEAAALYEGLGFREIEAYTVNPVPGARFLQLEL
jgi:ribosomal protein S18 acetylase RimI-like enzyme